MIEQSVEFSTSIGSGDSAGEEDFTATSGILTFVEGETFKTFTVQTMEDHVLERNETFTVSLINATGEAVIDPTASTATGTITD